MYVRTYYWDQNIISGPRFYYKKYFQGKRGYFRHGNAGDIYSKSIIKYLYGCESLVSERKGSRLLLVGSLSHRVMENDIVCGIGSKGKPFPEGLGGAVEIWGLRGPITFDLFKKKGFDVSKVKFLLDPGLFIKFTVNPAYFKLVPENISFIPHYRERDAVKGKLPKGFKLIDIDSDPHEVARKILKSKIIYSSSLHGIIFSHALGRPCVFVRPQTAEPLVKFEDYFLSVGLKYPKPLENIYRFDFARDSATPADINIKKDSFVFPTLEYLKKRNVLTEMR